MSTTNSNIDYKSNAAILEHCIDAEALEDWQIRDIIAVVLTNKEKEINPKYRQPVLDFIINRMLLSKREISESWQKTLERARLKNENPPELWQFMVEKYYTEFLGVILELAKEEGVKPAVVEGGGDYSYCFIYKCKLLRTADQRLLKVGYWLTQRTVKQGSIPRARWAIAQHAVTLSLEDLNPPGYLLMENGLVLEPETLTVREKFDAVFTHSLGAEIDEKNLDSVKSIVDNYSSWLEGEHVIREIYCPTFSRVFESVFPTEKEKLQALEAFGAIFFPAPLRKAFVIVGEPGIGKSVMADAIKHTLGGYAAALSFSRLFARDGAKVTGELAGKYANIVSESPNMLLTHTDMFNELTGDEERMVEVKFKRPFRARNYCKHYIFCNKIPLFAHVDEAVLERLYIIESTGTKPENPDPTLRDKMKKEAKGILMWLLVNYHFFKRQGYAFKHAPTVEEVEQAVSKAASPILEFIEMCCETGAGYRETGDELYTAYLQFARAKGDLKPLGRNRFYDALRAAGYPGFRSSSVLWFKGLRLLKTEETRSHLTDY